ncbi:MAG: hypothetical protein CSA53_06665 [Gammaproteobacteria bacterium]|nr:MAG: hypothetical protein CSA53_06665 [Gammaproteobacteria bacterium]
MSKDSTLKKLEQWKEKYYQALQAKEQQEQYQSVLEKGLGRLALASQGLDKNLDQQIKKLREALRKGSNSAQLNTLLTGIEEAILGMEEARSDGASAKREPGEPLARLLTRFDPPKAFRARVKNLIKQAHGANDKDLAKLTDDIGQLLDEILKDSASKSGFSLFGKKSDKKASTETSAADMLMHLLERLSLPPDIAEQSDALRARLAANNSDDELPDIVEHLADIINALGNQVIADKAEYGEFLQNLAKQIEALDEHIRDSRIDEKTAFEERQALGKKVEAQVSGIANHVAGANSLDELKDQLAERLSELADQVDDYRQADLDRYARASEEIEQLSHRLHTMEQEAQALRAAIAKSRELALKDALTGIWNRHAFDDAIDKEFARFKRYGKPVTLVVWDIDWFKRINDSYGHAAGDKALQAIASIFQRATRATDFVARYGGEEFVGLLPETSANEALTMANKVRKHIEESSFHYEDKPIAITVSAGLTQFTQDDTPDSVFKRADQALYKAKEQRNRCIVL